MTTTTVLLVVLLASALLSTPFFVTAQEFPDEHLLVPELIEANGFPAESHTVTTEDGYILTIHRIPGGRGEKNINGSKPVVYLQHGLLDSSATWIMNSAEQSLGFLLADAGYDVWLGNSRGNLYGQGHVNLSINDEEFWEFSWDQMAQYDLPAKLEYIMDYTGQEKLTYIGHSEGTTIGFAAFSSGTLANHLNYFVALAPVTYLGHLAVPFLDALFALPPNVLEDFIGAKSFFNSSNDVVKALPWICHLITHDCDDILCLISGCGSTNNLNSTRLPVFLGHFPAGTSVQNILHYQQGVDTKNWTWYNYGTQGNENHYGQPMPPIWNDRTLIPKTIIFSGSEDLLADPTDVNLTLREIPKPYYYEDIDGYGHADFVWAEDARHLIYDKILSLIGD